ncbi:MAG: hypothetical protein ACLFPQ_04405 [Candidatus Woesearchaeota archaeon]
MCRACESECPNRCITIEE